MRLRAVFIGIVTLLGAWGVLRAQRPFREYEAVEYENFPLPEDYQQPAEWTRARLRYRAILNVHPQGPATFGVGVFENGPLSWTIDYPRSDRHLLAGIRRLTRIDTRSVEQVVDMDNSDDIYNWPMLYAVEAGHWTLNDEEASQLREFLLRGGFLMVDDFHGTVEWNIFMNGLRKILPDRAVVDLDSRDPIFHTVFDLNDRVQVPGAQYLYSGQTYEFDGFQAKWRGVYDDHGRVMVAICHNMDLGDAWEWSDDPKYPEKFAALAYRIAVNYVMYDLTH
jgi:hypothetical protein